MASADSISSQCVGPTCQPMHMTPSPLHMRQLWYTIHIERSRRSLLALSLLRIIVIVGTSPTHVDGIQLSSSGQYIFELFFKMTMMCGNRSGNGRRYRLSMLLSWLSHFFFVAHGVRCFHDLIWLLFPINLHFLFHLMSHYVNFSLLHFQTQ